MAGTVRLRRETRPYRDRARAWKVLVDGFQVAAIRDGQSISVPVPPGEHTLRLKVDWTGSPGITFRVDDGYADFVAYPSGSAVSIVWQLIPSFWNHTNWITLRPASTDEVRP